MDQPNKNNNTSKCRRWFCMLAPVFVILLYWYVSVSYLRSSYGPGTCSCRVAIFIEDVESLVPQPPTTDLLSCEYAEECKMRCTNLNESSGVDYKKVGQTFCKILSQSVNSMYVEAKYSVCNGDWQEAVVQRQDQLCNRNSLGT
ncbi:unnamed protein product [Meganyctiphanes norvegica]|uniref:Uncharacterized protein n=1 Tax=Meganyctiphanes norvegica TaxID=48144 RepID=A0AAV2S5L9_MEGNR